LASALEVSGTWASDAHTVSAGDELVAALRDLLGLAVLLERGAYGGQSLTSDDVVGAEGASRRVRRTLRRRQVRALVGPVRARRRREPVPSSATGG